MKQPRLLLGSCLLLMLGFALPALGAADSASGPRNSWLGVDLIYMLKTTDFVGKLCMALLAVFSVISWMVIIYKFLHIRQASVQTEAFIRVCNHGSGRLDEAFKVAGDFPDSPLAQILREGYLELEIENWYREGYGLDAAGRIELAKVGIERVFDRTITNELTHLESNLVFLATATSVCPFIGLFGTVWGIMIALQEFGFGGEVSLSQLAPGLSTAMLVTVGGLFCAIPASLMYNYLTTRVRILAAQMDSFALELSNIVQKQIMKQYV